MEVLNQNNFLLYAARYYDNPSCESIEEFYDDLNRFKYLKRLFSKYVESGELKERLVLNHLIALYNLFGAIPTTKMLFSKVDEEHWHILKPFLVYLGYLPDKIYGVNGKSCVICSDIKMDQDIVDRLRNFQ
jgi:hypothetical protein